MRGSSSLVGRKPSCTVIGLFLLNVSCAQRCAQLSSTQPTKVLPPKAGRCPTQMPPKAGQSPCAVSACEDSACGWPVCRGSSISRQQRQEHHARRQTYMKFGPPRDCPRPSAALLSQRFSATSLAATMSAVSSARLLAPGFETASTYMRAYVAPCPAIPASPRQRRATSIVAPT